LLVLEGTVSAINPSGIGWLSGNLAAFVLLI
jgi:hypothetical protein